MTDFDYNELVDGHHDVAITVLRKTLRKIESIRYEKLSRVEIEDIVLICRNCVMALEALYEEIV